jgi:hypothetical protein
MAYAVATVRIAKSDGNWAFPDVFATKDRPDLDQLHDL